MASCVETAAELGLVEGLKTSIDCNISGLVQVGYASIAGPQSQLPAALGALLTIYIAVFGLRLMLGYAPLRIGDVTLTILKLVVVLALATSWPLYQQLIFDTLYRGPEQIAAAFLGGGSSSEQAMQGALGSLQVAYDEMQASSTFFAQRTSGVGSPFIGGPGFAAFALNASSILMLMLTIGLMQAAKVVLALLLVMGPIFIAFLLFDATRGLFEGWLRAAVAFALAPILGVVTLVITLNLIQPHLARLAVVRALVDVDIAPAIAVFCIMLIISAVTVAGVIAMGIIATGFKLNWKKAAPATRSADAVADAPHAAQDTVTSTVNSREPEAARRSSQISAAAAAMELRDMRLFVNPSPVAATTGGREQGSFDSQAQPALGQTYRRSAQRRSASSARRDG